MSDAAQIEASYGGRQMPNGSGAIVASFGGRQPVMQGSVTTIAFGAAVGSTVATIADPFAGLGMGTTTYSVVGQGSPALALSNGAIVLAALPTYRKNFITIEALAGDGKTRIAQTLEFSALSTAGGSVTPSLNGFYLNGSTNPALKAAVARVKAGTGRARFAVSGDSTSAGEGGGALINTIYFQNARPNRPSSVIAQQLSSAGVRALDTGFLGDNGAFVGSKASLTDYDPRVQASWKATSSTATQWSDVSAQTWPGGAILGSSSGAPLTFAPSDPVDTFEVVVYNSTGGSGSAPLSFLIDGAAPASVSVASGTATVSGSTATVFNGTGFSKLLVKAAGPGNHTLSLSSTTTLIALRSVLPYNSQLPAVDIENFAVRAATAANQASTNANGFYNLDALKFDAPDFTMINLGLNDINLSVAVSTYTANLQAIITAAKLSGDVLLIFPHYGKTGSGFVNNIDAYHAAAKSLAASNNVALFSLYDYYGTSLSDGSQFADGVVHPTAALYAQFGAVEAQAINAMLSS